MDKQTRHEILARTERTLSEFKRRKVKDERQEQFGNVLGNLRALPDAGPLVDCAQAEGIRVVLDDDLLRRENVIGVTSWKNRTVTLDAGLDAAQMFVAARHEFGHVWQNAQAGFMYLPEIEARLAMPFAEVFNQTGELLSAARHAEPTGDEGPFRAMTLLVDWPSRVRARQRDIFNELRENMRDESRSMIVCAPYTALLLQETWSYNCVRYVDSYVKDNTKWNQWEPFSMLAGAPYMNPRDKRLRQLREFYNEAARPDLHAEGIVQLSTSVFPHLAAPLMSGLRDSLAMIFDGDRLPTVPFLSPLSLAFVNANRDWRHRFREAAMSVSSLLEAPEGKPAVPPRPHGRRGQRTQWLHW